MNELTDIILKTSKLNPSLQKRWKRISDKSIQNKLVEPLTSAGLIQAIDRLAYEIINDGAWCAESQLTDHECDCILEKKIAQMDEIVNVIALASGIHPTAIDFVVGLRTDVYTDYYIDNMDK